LPKFVPWLLTQEQNETSLLVPSDFE
jgi:hypothetical protein